jgi:hypothetical protein
MARNGPRLIVDDSVTDVAGLLVENQNADTWTRGESSGVAESPATLFGKPSIDRWTSSVPNPVTAMT